MIKMETKDRIVQLLEDIVEKAHHINSHPEKELCLELDLVMEDLRSLYREYANLKKDCQERHVRHGSEIPPPPPTRDEPGLPPPAAKTTEAPPAAEKPSEPSVEETPEAPPVEEPPVTPPPATETPAPEPPAAENFASQRVEDSPAASPAGETHSPPPAAESPEVPRAAAIPPPRPPITQSGPLPENNPQKVPGNATRSIGERFPADNNSLHERISTMKEDRSIGARMQQHPISNIKDAIGVNEKFLFINELFNGNIQAYHEAIATLNSLGSVQAAFDHLNELNIDNKWDAERSAATIEKLANFVQRRYMNK